MKLKRFGFGFTHKSSTKRSMRNHIEKLKLKVVCDYSARASIDLNNLNDKFVRWSTIAQELRVC